MKAPRNLLFTIFGPVAPDGRERLDMMLMALVLEQEVSLLFAGQGVGHLAPVSHLQPVDKPWTAAYASLPIYGLKNAFACERSLNQFGIDPAAAVLPVVVVGEPRVQQLIRGSDICL